MLIEQEADQSKSTSTIMFLCIGAAVGACAMLLYAPKHGEEIRSQIGEKASKVRTKVEELTDVVTEKVEAIKDRALDIANGNIDRHENTLRFIDRTAARTYQANKREV